MDEKEIWKVYKIVRRFNQYKELNPTIWEVSNFGRVKKNGEIYECRIGTHGYLVFGSAILLHRAVAESFIPNPDNKPYVDHKDTNRMNNHVNNLQWVTPSENNLNPITRQRHIGVIKGNKFFYGKTHSDESKQKMSNAFKGRHIVLCADGKRHWV